MRLRRAAYQALPDAVQPLAQHGYVALAPGLSWRKWARTEEQFVEEFFDDRDEFDAYVGEFWSSGINDVCVGAEHETPDDVEVYDAHRFVSERLYALIRKRRPETVVETGVFHGVSTASMLMALRENGSGTLYSIDPTPEVGGDSGHQGHRANGTAEHLVRDRPSCAERGSHELPPGREPGWIVPDDLRRQWNLRTGRTQRELPALLSEVGGVDLFVHDSEHSRSCMHFEFDLAWEWLREGGVLVSHHVGWNDAFQTFVEERSADHGLLSYTYFGKYELPGRSAYAVKR